MKRKQILILFLCMLFLLLTLASCSNNVDIAYVDSRDDRPLMIYIWDQDDYMKYHINNYNALFDGTKIEYEAFTTEYLKYMYPKMKEGIKQGKGPDLILIDYDFQRRNDIYELIEDDMFADIDELIKRSQRFDSSEYNMKVLDAGIVNDKRVLVPVSYNHNITIGYKNNFTKHGLEIPTELTPETLLDLLNRYYQNTPKESVAMISNELEQSLFSYLNDDNQIDNLHGLDELLEAYKKNYKRMGNSTFFNVCNNETFDWYKWSLENDILFDRLYGRLGNLYYQYNLIKNSGSDIVIYNYPLTVEKSKTTPFRSFAISSTSDKKNSAFKFTEYMLSKEVQSAPKHAPIIPVNLDSYDLAKQRLINGDYNYFKDSDITPVPVPLELVYQLTDIVENAECELDNYKYIYDKCFLSPIHKYYSGSLELQYVVDEINDNLYKYYNDEEEE